MMLKQAWLIYTQPDPDLLLSRIFKAKILQSFRKQGLAFGTRPSHVWRPNLFKKIKFMLNEGMREYGRPVCIHSSSAEYTVKSGYDLFQKRNKESLSKKVERVRIGEVGFNQLWMLMDVLFGWKLNCLQL